MPPVKAKPSIKLLPDAGPVYMQYGTPAPMYVGPCSSGAENSSCGAVASQNDPTRGVQDLTPYILVTQTAECDSADGRVRLSVAAITCLRLHEHSAAQQESEYHSTC